MTTTSVEAPVARSYTRARRHPWVLGKLGEIRLWLGPYSRPQLVVAGVGLLVLGKTIPWWWPLFGPLPMAGLGFAVWAARCARIGGRVPEAAVWGWIVLLVQPRQGRIGGRPAKDRAARLLRGGFFLTETGTSSGASSSAGVTPEPSGPAWPAAVPDIRPGHRLPTAAVWSVPRPPRSARPERAGAKALPKAVPPADSRTGAGAGPTSPRSSLDLLLEQTGVRSRVTKGWP